LGSDKHFGSEGIVCLINPKNVVAVPEEYRFGKMRVCEYLPIAVAERNDSGCIIEVDTELFELELIESAAEELERVTLMDANEFEEYKKHEYLPLDFDFNSIFTIQSINMSLEEANEIIKNRDL